MEPMLRWFVLVAGGLLAAGFVTVLLEHANLPSTQLEIGGRGPIVISIPALVVIVLSFGLAWCYVVMALLYAHPVLRVAVLACFTVAMLDLGTAFSPTLQTGRAAILLAGIISLWLTVGAYTVRASQQDRPQLSPKAERLGACLVFILTATIQLAAWWASLAAHVAGVFALGFVFDITVFALLAAVFLASSGGNFAQVADLISSAVSHTLDQRRRTYLLAALALTGGLVARAVIGASASLPEDTALAIAATILISAVAWRHREALATPGRLPSWATVLAGALVAATLITASALALSGEISSSNTPTGYVAVIALGLAALPLVVLLVARPTPAIAATALCTLSVLLLAGLSNLREGVALIAGHTIEGFPHVNLKSIEATMAIALSLLIMATLWCPARMKPRIRAALPLVAILATTVLMLDPLFNLYAGAAFGSALSVGGIAFLFVAFMWDMAFSGDITNGDGRIMRRPARVLIYVAYMLAASATVLYFSSGHSLGKLQVEEVFDPAADIAVSIVYVGIAYAAITCVARLASTQVALSDTGIGPPVSSPP
jgi:hypothetical protein